MAYVTETHINKAAEAIVAARDLCGNERRAMLETLREAGIADRDIARVSRVVMARANNKWREHKRDAGVAPKYWL